MDSKDRATKKTRWKRKAQRLNKGEAKPTVASPYGGIELSEIEHAYFCMTEGSPSPLAEEKKSDELISTKQLVNLSLEKRSVPHADWLC